MSLGKLANYFFNNRAGCKDWKEEPIRYLQEKKDGYRMTFIKETDGQIIALGRTQDYWDLLSDYLTVSILVNGLPKGSVIDGELHVEGARSTDVVTAMKSQDPRLTFSAFAAPVLDNKSQEEQPLELINLWLAEHGFKIIPCISFLGKPNHDDLLNEALRRKIEGFVGKNAHYSQWYKIKPEKTCDLVVVDWQSGTGKYSGLMGALICGAYHGKEMITVASVGGGFSDQQRKEYIPKKCLGRVVEVMYQDVLAKGGLRYPRFVRFRDDKPARECTVEQLK